MYKVVRMQSIKYMSTLVYFYIECYIFESTQIDFNLCVIFLFVAYLIVIYIYIQRNLRRSFVGTNGSES